MNKWTKDKYEKYIAELEEKLKAKDYRPGWVTDHPLHYELPIPVEPIIKRPKKYKLLDERLKIWCIIDSAGNEVVGTGDACTTIEKAWELAWERDPPSYFASHKDSLRFVMQKQAQGYKVVSKEFILIVN